MLNTCPCGSMLNYDQCCSLYIEQHQLPLTPEALMRSRYTAYTQANTAYIKATMAGKPLIGFDELEVKQWASKVTWLGLEVLDKKSHPTNQDIGYVEFIANLKEGNKNQAIHERSEFERINGRWIYTAGHKPLHTKSRIKKAIPRNASCPCGSLKKYKNCHG